MGCQGTAAKYYTNTLYDICQDDKMKGLQIWSFSVEITNVGNVSKNTNNEQNEVNYTENLKEKDQRFCPST